MPETNELLQKILENQDKQAASLSNLEKKVDDLDKKIDVTAIELKSEINRVDEKLSGEIKRVEEKLEGEIKRVEEKIDGTKIALEKEIKRVDEKLTAKIDGLDKRLSNEELISRGAYLTIVAGGITALVKFFFFSTAV